MQRDNNLAAKGEPIYTLAQSRKSTNNNPEVLLKGNGSSLSDIDIQQARAKRKHVTKSLVKEMILIAHENEDQESLDTLWNIYRCHSKLYVKNGKIHGTYCRTHVCSLCNANRKAQLIKKYLKVIQSWPDPHMLTLTSKAVPAAKLQKHVDATFRALRQIRDNHRKKVKSGRSGLSLIGIRSIECEFNPKKRSYNPHIHLLVPNKETADVIKSAWLKKWTSRFAHSSAQHIRRVNSTERDMIEVIKYGTKIFTEFDKRNKNSRSPKKIYPRAHYNIFKAFKGRRLFDRFGFNSQETQPCTLKGELTSEYEYYEYDNKSNGWVNTNTGDHLFHYSPDMSIQNLLESCMELHIS